MSTPDEIVCSAGCNLPPPRTGWHPGMLQDDSRDLSRWFASKPNAKREAKDVADAILRSRAKDKP